MAVSVACTAAPQPGCTQSGLLGPRLPSCSANPLASPSENGVLSRGFKYRTRASCLLCISRVSSITLTDVAQAGAGRGAREALPRHRGRAGVAGRAGPIRPLHGRSRFESGQASQASRAGALRQANCGGSHRGKTGSASASAPFGPEAAPRRGGGSAAGPGLRQGISLGTDAAPSCRPKAPACCQPTRRRRPAEPRGASRRAACRGWAQPGTARHSAAPPGTAAALRRRSPIFFTFRHGAATPRHAASP